MKGFFFAKPFEFRLETPAEEWTQGEVIEGSLHVTNRDGTEAMARLEVGLAYGLQKKIKAGSSDAFEFLAREILEDSVRLPPDGEQTGRWRFQLPRDCPVTSKEGALFLLYGNGLDQPGRWSKIDLRVAPCPELQGLVTTLENHFQFDAVSAKYDKGFTEFRLRPPGAYPSMEVLLLRARLDEDMNLDMECRFRMKKLARGAEPGVTTGTVKVSRRFSPTEYLTPLGQLNRPFAQEMFRELLAEVVPAMG